MEKKFIINENLAKAILQYLAARPFGEVHQLVGALQQVEELKEEKNEEAKAE